MSATSQHASNTLTARQSLTVGITLFSMFFGAGNLILPPLLGWQAGVETPAAMAGFLVAAIGLPVAGVVSSALAGDLHALGRRVHPAFATAYAVLIYLSIGPCLAIPRTASTAFEMLQPFMGGADPALAQLVFSLAFFALACVCALNPSKLTQLLGRVTGPLLIALIVVVVGAAVVFPSGAPGAAQAPYSQGAAAQGFLCGYQTMDLLASLTFGIVIAQNIRELGVREPGGVSFEVVKAGVVMGVLMALVYCGTAAVGTLLGNDAGAMGNGAAVLVASARVHLGVFGTAGVAAIFLLACLNVCIGLLCCCGTFFEGLLPRVAYRWWVIGFAAFGCMVSNLGLNAILAFSGPLLSALYPVAIVLTLMGVFCRAFDRVPLAWPWAVGATACVSVAYSLRDAFAPEAVLSVLDALPVADLGLGWVLPALLALVVGVAHSLAVRRRR